MIDVQQINDFAVMSPAQNKFPGRRGCLYGCLVLLAAVILFVVWVNWMLFGNHAAWADHVAVYERAPANARDISWYESRDIAGNVSFEFLITEAEFRAWAASRKWDLIEISKTEWRMAMSCRRFIHPHDNKAQKVNNGLFYERRTSNGGGITVVFDRSQARTYVNQSSR